MQEAASTVTNLLLLAVPLYCLGVILPVLLLIVGMLLPPLLLAFPHSLAILGICRQLLAVIIRATPTLTFRLTANPLLRTVSGRQKRTLAVWTTAGLAQVDSSEFEGGISEENQNHREDAREMKTDFTLPWSDLISWRI
jgi:hypothetical protein